jgi:hypothetical protein
MEKSVKESEQVLEWIAEGEVKGRAQGEAEAWANGLLKVLRARFPPGAPPEVAAIIQATTDLEQLRRWFDEALDAASLDAFRKAAGL